MCLFNLITDNKLGLYSLCLCFHLFFLIHFLLYFTRYKQFTTFKQQKQPFATDRWRNTILNDVSDFQKILKRSESGTLQFSDIHASNTPQIPNASTSYIPCFFRLWVSLPPKPGISSQQGWKDNMTLSSTYCPSAPLLAANQISSRWPNTVLLLDCVTFTAPLGGALGHCRGQWASHPNARSPSPFFPIGPSPVKLSMGDSS